MNRTDDSCCEDSLCEKVAHESLRLLLGHGDE
jgi:hypothetical protein